MADNKTQHKGQSLTGLIGTRRVEGPVPPIISVGRIPMSVIDSIADMPISIERVSSNAVDSYALSDKIAESMDKAIDKHLSGTTYGRE